MDNTCSIPVKREQKNVMIASMTQFDCKPLPLTGEADEEGAMILLPGKRPARMAGMGHFSPSVDRQVREGSGLECVFKVFDLAF